MSWFCWHDWLVVRETNNKGGDAAYFPSWGVWNRNKDARNKPGGVYRWEFSKEDKICRKCDKVSLKLTKAIKKEDEKRQRWLDQEAAYRDYRAVLEANDDERKKRVQHYIELARKV